VHKSLGEMTVADIEAAWTSIDADDDVTTPPS
jgi:hypothetical protein